MVGASVPPWFLQFPKAASGVGSCDRRRSQRNPVLLRWWKQSVSGDQIVSLKGLLDEARLSERLVEKLDSSLLLMVSQALDLELMTGSTNCHFEG